MNKKIFITLALALCAFAPNVASAANPLWWSYYANYEGGWPNPHAGYRGECNWSFFHDPLRCPLYTYASASLTNTPSQGIVAMAYLRGYSGGYSYSPITYTGSLPAVSPNTSVTLNWACQDFQAQSYSTPASCISYDAFNNCNGWSGGGGGTGYAYDYAYAVFNGTVQSNLGGTVVAPTQTTTYSVYCQTAGWSPNPTFGIPAKPNTPTMQFTVNVSGPPLPAPPTESIDAGMGPGVTKTVTVGTPVMLTATYLASTGDTLTDTAINGPNNTNSVPGVPWTPPASPKTYLFSTTTPGSYTFSPALRTTYYHNWNDYGAAVTVIVTVPPACTGAHEVNPPTCSCEIGYNRVDGSCVLATCLGAHQVPPLCSTCESGYQMQSGSCVIAPPSISISASQPRVARNTSATIVWSVTGLEAGGGTQCAISSAPAGVFSQSMPANTAPTWSGSAPTTGITGSATITLVCTGAVSKTISVGLLPAYQER